MAMATQVQYRSLHYVSFWELAICNLSLWDITESLRYWMLLDAEATWSKACYAYGMAVCILHSDNTTSRTNEADQLLQKIPKVVHKIAGKSIPIEVPTQRDADNKALNILFTEICCSKSPQIFRTRKASHARCIRAGIYILSY